MAGPQSGKFRFFLRAHDWVVKHARAPVRFLVENTFMGEDPLRTISRTLGVKPLRVTADRVCAASRDRLYWVSSHIQPPEGEEVEHKERFVTVRLREDPKRLDVLRPGWRFHERFPGWLGRIVGYRPAVAPPRVPAGLGKASDDAKHR